MQYELVLILKPELAEEPPAGALEKIAGLIAKAGGKIVKKDSWGRRDLAYPINKFSEGLYQLLNIELPANSAASLERSLRLEESLLRFLMVRVDERKGVGDR